MANSKATIREIRCLVRGADGQGAIDVYVFTSCPDFQPAHGWRTKQCPADEPLVAWLAENIVNYLEWAVGTPENS